MEELDIKTLIYIVIKRWWLICLSTVLVAGAAAAYTFFAITPVYQSDTSIYIGRDTDTQNTIAYNDLMVGSQLVNDYRELVKSRMVTSRVIKELNLKDITVGQMADKIGVNSKKDTRLIEITALDPDPAMARRIADKVAAVFKEKVVEVMKIENVQIIDKAVLPNSPAKPNKKMNLAIGLVLGMMLGVGIVFLIEFLDDTIKTPDDVQKHLDIPVIGTIPVFPDMKY